MADFNNNFQLSALVLNRCQRCSERFGLGIRVKSNSSQLTDGFGQHLNIYRLHVLFTKRGHNFELRNYSRDGRPGKKITRRDDVLSMRDIISFFARELTFCNASKWDTYGDRSASWSWPGYIRSRWTQLAETHKNSGILVHFSGNCRCPRLLNRLLHSFTNLQHKYELLIANPHVVAHHSCLFFDYWLHYELTDSRKR